MTMKKNLSRKGSALLIVLGMLAFMVISSVSFAVFMREGRKPSSYLRRSLTSRALLKAALANAISRIDGVRNEDRDRVEGIYDDLYPGVGPSLNEIDAENGGLWINRVFMPFGQTDTDFTVSTLTFESLAYLPPAIINEVRVLSRRTNTAKWKNLSYDLGRYAFCAVDVSDCFDINKVRANERRTSASNQRFNMSALFPDNAAELDQVLDKVIKQTPNSFISMADFNVVAGKGCPFAPWMDYVGSSGTQIYNKDDYLSVSNALFITDTWFPPTNNIGKVNKKFYNLEAGGKSQPWRTFDASSAEDALDTLNDPGIGAAIFKMLQGVGIACLYDYLDEDQIPLSYCMPCTETAPMVCALGIDKQTCPINIAFKTAQVSTGDYGPMVMINGVKKPKYTVTVKKCTLDVKIPELSANGVVAFPFKRVHVKKGYKTQFSGEALFRVFFAPVDAQSRLIAGDDAKMVHPSLKGKKWNSLPQGWQNGVFTAHASSIKGELSFSKEILLQEDALGEFSASAESNDPNASLPVFYIVEQSDNQNGGTESWYSLDGLKADPKLFQPREKNGEICKWWTDLLNAAEEQLPEPAGGTWTTLPSGQGRSAKEALNAQEFVPHVAVWVRLFDGEETYDISPARPEDDEIYGDRNLPQLKEWIDPVAGGDGNSPILEFEGDTKIKLDMTALAADLAEGKDVDFTQWNRLYVADPRYNFAPENWYAAKETDSNIKKIDWLNSIKSILGNDGRDRDIFMFTSDQEYLQSIGELAFIPRVGDADTAGNQINRHYIRYTDFNGKSFSTRKGNTPPMGDLGQEEFYWMTYAAYNNGDGVDGIYTLREGGTRANEGVECEITAGQNDFRANPYSQDPRIMAAVVESTPFDFFAASTNDLNTLYSNPEEATPKDAEQYVFTGNKKNQNSAGYIEGFSGIAEGLRRSFINAAKDSNAKTGKNMNWEAVYDNLPWKSNSTGDDQYDFLGITLEEPLYGVDRKFLHAFWRDCFQNRQQLFLVFIRAEPLTVGGMGFGSLAATQLGARGVALVWRDPLPPVKNRDQRKMRNQLTRPNQWREMFEQSGPHRTRILFYHQID